VGRDRQPVAGVGDRPGDPAIARHAS
jgi:hypothetical protein